MESLGKMLQPLMSNLCLSLEFKTKLYHFPMEDLTFAPQQRHKDVITQSLIVGLWQLFRTFDI